MLYKKVNSIFVSWPDVRLTMNTTIKQTCKFIRPKKAKQKIQFLLSQCVTSFGVKTGAGISTVCMQGPMGDIPPDDSELHLDSLTMAGWWQSGLFKHVKAEEPLRESNKAYLRAKGCFIRISRGFSACFVRLGFTRGNGL